MRGPLQEQVLRAFPGVWGVAILRDAEGCPMVEIKARPDTEICMIRASRIVASFVKTCYTVVVRFLWRPIRYRLLFGVLGR